MARSGIYEGQKANTGSNQPYQKEAVYRLDAQTGQVTKVADEPFKPNGIAFSHDYKKVYVCDTGITHYPDAQTSSGNTTSMATSSRIRARCST